MPSGHVKHVSRTVGRHGDKHKGGKYVAKKKGGLFPAYLTSSEEISVPESNNAAQGAAEIAGRSSSAQKAMGTC